MLLSDKTHALIDGKPWFLVEFVKFLYFFLIIHLSKLITLRSMRF